MLVTEILKAKGDAVFTVGPEQTVREAARLLMERRVGAMIVLEGDRVVGILSERDIVGAVAREGEAALGEPVSGCMTREVVYAQPTETVDALMGRMTDRRIRHLPVMRAERLCGVVSIGDLVKSKIGEVEAEREGLRAYIAAG